MGKLLKVFTVIILLLSIFAFVLGLSNFSKRELLIGRTKMFEDKLPKITAYIEDKAPTFDGIGPDIQRDVSPVEERMPDSIDEVNFWEQTKYDATLELGSGEMLKLGSDESQRRLKTFYQMEKNAEGKFVYVKDMNGQKVSRGKGTMDELLEATIVKSKEQFERLNKTRSQLGNTRRELENVIGLLNDEKRSHRSSKATIKEQREEINSLKLDIEKLNTQVSRLQREVRDRDDQIADRDKTIAEQAERITDFSQQINKLKEEVRNLKTEIDLLKGGGGTITSGPNTEISLSAGEKGTVVDINKELAFAIVKLNDIAKNEITANGTKFAANTEFMVYRKDAKTIVNRVRIITPPDANNNSVVQFVYGWEQLPVQTGDILINP